MFEWDQAKSDSNLLKHGIGFDEASAIFADVILSRSDDRFGYGEKRYISIGVIQSLVVVAVVHTDRAGHTRIISARIANRKERRLYDEHLGRETGGP